MEKTKEQSNPLHTGIPLRQTSAVSSVEPLADRDDTIPKLNQEEHDVTRLLFYFPEVIENAAKNFAPNILCSYLFYLAQTFNLLYAKHPISENDLRVMLTEKTAATLKEGLYLLGIETVERM